jgi:hypothetical protein
MKPNEERDKLLDDILGGEDAVWRNVALAKVRRVARQRRFVRRARSGAVVLILGAAFAITLRVHDKPAPGSRFPGSRDWIAIHSEPLPLSMITRSTQDGFTRIRTSGVQAQLVRTDSAGDLPKQIDDEELLRLTGNSAILVRYAPGDAELVVSDSANSLFATPGSAPGN